jgi:hypothetical protein
MNKAAGGLQGEKERQRVKMREKERRAKGVVLKV